MQENQAILEARNFTSRLNKMNIIAFADVDFHEGTYFATAKPYGDVKMKPLSLQTQDPNLFLEELELYYEKVKGKEFFTNVHDTFARFAIGIALLWAYASLGVFGIFSAFVLISIQRAGLTDEAKVVAIDIIKTTISELISWIQ